MSLIELGDVSSEPDGGPHRVTEFRHGTVRRLVLVALVVLCVATLGASARPAPPLVRELWSVPISDPDLLAVHDGVVLVHRLTDARAEVTGYDAVTGRVRWTRLVGQHSAGLETVERAGVLLLPGEQETDSGTMTAVDAATGATLWHRPGAYHLAVEPEATLLAAPGPEGSGTMLRLVRTRDGGTIWERAAPNTAESLQVQADGTGPARVVIATASGEVTLLDYATGTPLLVRRLPWSATEAETGDGSSVTTSDGLLMVTRTRGIAHTITAYRIGTLERLWSANAPTYLWAQGCGPVVCLTSDDGTIVAVDPDTGARRWSRSGFPMTGLVPGDVSLLVMTNDQDPRPMLIDAATGEPRGPASHGWVAYGDRAAGFAVLIESTVTAGARSGVIRFDLTTGRSTPLGTVELIGNNRCTGSGGLLLCQTGGRLAVNRLG
ncbi:MAG TPA: PQQ-binding-like beta-propeller repeat protein [Actinoplanes sp.]|nr:PQQ-binding-like beta-propeller repeat protein [Actinoplanes sp.]